MTATFQNEREQMPTGLGFSLWGRRALCDETVIDEVIVRDCYRLSGRLDGQTVLDCGAHVGVFSTFCAYRGAASVVAVEPQPENLELLRLNAAPWPQIGILAEAVGAAHGTTRISGESGGAHTGDDLTGVEVQQTTLASLLEYVGRVDLLKLDMEGGEVDALLACSHDHLARVQRIVLETHGPAICPWVEHARVGEVLQHLLPTHNVEAQGFPTHLGLAFATRNGCSYGWPT